MSPAAWTEIVTNIGVALSDIGDPDDVKRIVRVVTATCGIPITPDAVLAMEREAFSAGNTGDMAHMRAMITKIATIKTGCVIHSILPLKSASPNVR